MTLRQEVGTDGSDPVISLPTLLNRIAVEQARLAGIVLALQDLISPRAGDAVYGSEAIRGLQSVDLVTQSLNDLARLTRAMAACAEAMGEDRGASGRHGNGRSPKTMTLGLSPDCGLDEGRDPAISGTELPLAGLMFDIRPLREILKLGDLAHRVLGAGDLSKNEEDSDVMWLGELAASLRQEGAA